MFIKKKIFNAMTRKAVEMRFEIDRLEKIEKISSDRIANLKTENSNLKEENKRLKDNVDILNSRCKSLDKINDDLIEENQKLLDWVNKILNDVVCYDVHDKGTVSIPVYKDEIMCSDSNSFLNYKEEIIVPEIRIIKFRR